MEAHPSTLLEAVQYFSDEDRCIKYLAAKRWPDGVAVCPTCHKKGAGFLAKQNRWQCSARHPKRQFSIKVGTVMEDSPIGLEKWLPVFWLVANCRNGISSWEIHRDLGVTQKTAWFMLHRARLAMQDDLTGGNLGGEVEVDETYIGGKARNMHAASRLRRHIGTGGEGKTIVLGILERASEKKSKRIRTSIISDRKRATIQPEVAGHVEAGSKVYADQFADFWKMPDLFEHEMVMHCFRAQARQNI